MPKASSVRWTREHALIALNLYGKLLFGQFHHNNPLIIDVASRMGRTPSSLAMKLSNLASLDPVQRARGIRGLSGASRQDREMWNEFHANLNDLGPESEQLLHDLFTTDNEQEVDFLQRDKVRLERSRDLMAPIGPRSHCQSQSSTRPAVLSSDHSQRLRRALLHQWHQCSAPACSEPHQALGRTS